MRFAFTCDYQEGAHPAILQRLMETNLVQTSGYGSDEFCEEAREKIRQVCGVPEAEVFFLVGGTQTNTTVIDAMLRSWQGVIAADSGHISLHEAGAIECCGHKVLQLPGTDGKITAEQIEDCCRAWQMDANREHMVMPGMVYLSQPTEVGTLYSLEELTSIAGVCRSYRIPLYVDGARLAYALACPLNDVTLPDLARLCDVFYIGGTKCGAYFGEAVVFPKNPVPHFFTMVKQHGALLAKGRLLGIQFGTLFTDGLYERIGEPAIRAANRIRAALRENGYEMAVENGTNQIFIILEDARLEKISRKAALDFWEKTDATHTMMRICTSWATTEEATEGLLKVLKES